MFLVPLQRLVGLCVNPDLIFLTRNNWHVVSLLLNMLLLLTTCLNGVFHSQEQRDREKLIKELVAVVPQLLCVCVLVLWKGSELSTRKQSWRFSTVSCSDLTAFHDMPSQSKGSVSLCTVETRRPVEHSLIQVSCVSERFTTRDRKPQVPPFQC